MDASSGVTTPGSALAERRGGPGVVTPLDVIRQLSRLTLELASTVESLEAADLAADRARREFDLAFSKAFLVAEGSVDRRKHVATVETYDQREAAEVAEAVVRHLRRELAALGTRIDVGRSYGAAIRAELAALPGTGT